MEQRIKHLEASNEEIASETDKLQTETTANLQALNTKIINNKIALSQNKEDIENLTHSLDKMARQGAEYLSQDISDDNPDQEEITLTYANLAGKGINAKGTSGPSKSA